MALSWWGLLPKSITPTQGGQFTVVTNDNRTMTLSKESTLDKIGDVVNKGIGTTVAVVTPLTGAKSAPKNLQQPINTANAIAGAIAGGVAAGGVIGAGIAGGKALVGSGALNGVIGTGAGGNTPPTNGAIGPQGDATPDSGNAKKLFIFGGAILGLILLVKLIWK